MCRWPGGAMNQIDVDVQSRLTVHDVFPEKPRHGTRQRHNTIIQEIPPFELPLTSCGDPFFCATRVRAANMPTRPLAAAHHSTFYNRLRRHSKYGYYSPVKFEAETDVAQPYVHGIGGKVIVKRNKAGLSISLSTAGSPLLEHFECRP